MPAPPVFVPPPKLVLALPPGVDARLLFALFLVFATLVGGGVAISAISGPTPVVIPVPVSIDQAPLVSAMQGALTSPAVKTCALDWRVRNPNKLAQRVDVMFQLAPGKASATFGGFLDEPLRACLADAHMARAFTDVVRDLPRPTELKGNLDLDALAPL